jgi:hypothetical protein
MRSVSGVPNSAPVRMDDARALGEADEGDGGQRASVAAGPGDRRLDGLQRPSQPRLVVLHRVVEAARIPRAPGRAGQDVGHLVVEREALRGLEHELGVEVAAVDEDGGHSGVGIAGAHQPGAEVRVAHHVRDAHSRTLSAR